MMVMVFVVLVAIFVAVCAIVWGIIIHYHTKHDIISEITCNKHDDDWEPL